MHSQAMLEHAKVMYLTEVNISFEKSEALDSQPMLGHAKVI